MGTLIFSCTQVFYQPDRYLYVPPEKIKLNYKNIYYSSLDNTRLHAWYFPSRKGDNKNKAKNLIVLFHGNAQNLSSHYLNISWMTDFGFDVFVWDYRGYGLSQGEAESEGIYKDAIATLDYTTKLFLEKKYKNFYIIGQSLGGSIILKTLSDYPLRWPITTLVIDSSFSSYRNIAKEKLSSFWPTFLFSPLTPLLISDKYSSFDELGNIKTPALVIHSKNDKVIPYSFGLEIYNKIGSSDKKLWVVEKAPHIGILGHHQESNKGIFIEYLKELSHKKGKK